MLVGKLAGALVPKNTAVSSALWNASMMYGSEVSQTSISMSAATFSGTGMMIASSSMVMNLFAHAISVVCFKPVSPVTHCATGSADRIGNRTWFRDTGMRRNRSSTAEPCVSLPSISRETSSGIVASTSARVVMLLYGTVYLQIHAQRSGRAAGCELPAASGELPDPRVHVVGLLAARLALVGVRGGATCGFTQRADDAVDGLVIGLAVLEQPLRVELVEQFLHVV